MVWCPVEASQLRFRISKSKRFDELSKAARGWKRIPSLNAETRVRVKCGPLTGIEGILVRKKNISRLVLSVEILGTAAAIEVAAFQVEAVNAPRVRDSRTGYGGGSRHTRDAEAIALA